MPGCPVRYMDVMEESSAMLGCPVGTLTSFSLALDPYMTSMYPTGYSSMILDPYMTSMYPTGSPAWSWTPS
jgi:hypothetical protein